MTRQIEWDFYIPPDATISTAGVIADPTDAYSFHDNAQKALMSFSGWGMPGIDWVTQKGPFQHGVTVLDYRLTPRIVQLVHRRTGGCRDDYWDHRLELINSIRPNRSASGSFERGRLRKIISDGTVRDLYVVLEKGPAFNGRGRDWDEWAIDETIRFIAHDPIIFNPSQSSATWGVLTSTNELIFPITFPILFGVDGLINQDLNVTYDGNWLTYPTITITGPLSMPEIYNVSTDEEIKINYIIPSGSSIVIDLNYGIKTVVENGVTNRIGVVSSDSDLATFHIAPDPEITGGVNTLRVIGTQATVSTSVAVTWFDKYIGI